MTDTTELLDAHTRVIPDFPEPGILFRDLTPVFADPEAFASVIDALTAPFEGAYDIVAGVEARGFALAAISRCDRYGARYHQLCRGGWERLYSRTC